MRSIWLRNETNPLEKRAILIPAHAGVLVRSGYPIYVESSSIRIHADDEYEEVGCQIVPSDSWQDAPLDAYILGIKGLPPAEFTLRHAHICLAYVYENEKGSKEMLDRFRQGSGMLLDLETLTDFRGKGIVTKSAGFWGGICGAAISVNLWCQKKLGMIPPYSLKTYYLKYMDLIEELITLLIKTGRPKVLIIGAYGMTGTGTRCLLDKLNVEYGSWTRDNTRSQGPFLEILDFDILLNCIVVKKRTSQFLTKDCLLENKRLSIIGDITCDPENPDNPLPFYQQPTTFLKPTVRITNGDVPIDLMSIDNLSSLLPLESSKAMSEQLLPYLCELLLANGNYKDTSWEYSAAEFYKRI